MKNPKFTPKRKTGHRRRVAVWHTLRKLPEVLLLKNIYGIELFIIVFGLLVGLGLSAIALLQTANVAPVDTPGSGTALSVETIDTLEFWLEERQAAYDTKILTTPGTYFGKPPSSL